MSRSQIELQKSLNFFFFFFEKIHLLQFFFILFFFQNQFFNIYLSFILVLHDKKRHVKAVLAMYIACNSAKAPHCIRTNRMILYSFFPCFWVFFSIMPNSCFTHNITCMVPVSTIFETNCSSEASSLLQRSQN